MKLSGNTILVTGGSGGIGLAFAKKFVELGNEVIITGRRQEKLDAAKAEEPKLHVVQSDAGDPQAVAQLGKQMAEKFPQLNVLFNNAGIMIYRNLRHPTGDLKELTREIDINLSGAIHVVSVLIEQILENEGTIINVSSGLAFVPLMAAPIYCATKAGLHSYTLSLRQQLAGTGVEVIELMPPATRTDLAHIPDDGGFKVMTTDELLEATMKKLKKGKLEIRPGQANGLRFMNRVAPGFIHGQLEKGSKGLVPQN